MKLSNYLSDQAARTPGRAPYPIRLTPGQYRQLCDERAAHSSNPAAIRWFETSLGRHPVERIDLPTRATGDNVILAPREDLFVESEQGIELVSLENSVTAIPDNMACCEILSVGELVQNVRVGDLAFIDFYDVKQGYIVSNDELYLCGADAFKGLYHDGRILPLANYVVTRRCLDRFKVALTGTDRLHVPASTLTTGIAGGRTSMGDAATNVIYEEVVSIGPLTKRPRPGVMTYAERKLIDMALSTDRNDPDALVIAALRKAISDVALEREHGRPQDITAGDLVVFCEQIANKIRVRGEVQHLIPYDNVLAVIDDAEILDNAIRAGKAGVIKLVG
jgi:hypothetical protein